MHTYHIVVVILSASMESGRAYSLSVTHELAPFGAAAKSLPTSKG